MAHGHKTGGRTAGTPNKASTRIADLVEQEAGAPLPVILARIGKMALDKGDLALAVTAFSKAAAYTYPRVQTVNWRSPAMDSQRPDPAAWRMSMAD